MSQSLNTRQFSSLVSEVQRIVQDTTSTNMRAAIKDALNRALDAAASLYDWPQLVVADDSGLRQLSDSTLATFIASDSFFPAPFAAGRIKSLIVQDQHALPVKIVTADELYERASATLTSTGLPEFAAEIGSTAQTRALAADGALTCTSSSSSNDNSKTVRVYFQMSSAHTGQRNWSDVTGSFSTGVSIGGGTQIESGYPIKAVSIPSGWAGSFVISDGGGTAIVSVQGVEQPATNTNDLPMTVQRKLFKLWPVPDADYAATVIWWRIPLAMTEDEDLPEIPVSSFLVAKAACDLFAQQGKTTEANVWANHAVAALRATIQQNTSTKITSVRPLLGNILRQNSYAWR